MDNINKLQEYYSVIHEVELKDVEQKKFFHNSIIQNIETIISAYITDMLKEFSLTDIGCLDEKKVNVVEVIKKRNLSEYITYEVEKFVKEFSYKSFSEQIEYFRKFKIEFADNQLIDDISEMIATRNILVHNKGIVNDQYLKQSKDLFRSEKGTTIPIDSDYVQKSLKNCKFLIEQFYKKIPSNYKNFGKPNVFKIMWESSVLEQTLPFSEAFTITKSNSILYNDIILDRYKENAFSHSEMNLITFFFHIFGKTTVQPYAYIDFQGLLYHFAEDSNELKMVSAWLENPFFL